MKKFFVFAAFVSLMSGWPGISSGQTLTIVSPNGGEDWKLDGSQVVSWTYAGMPEGTRVKLLLFLNGAPAGTIAGNLPVGQKSYAWKVGALEGGGTAVAADGYKVRIKAVSQDWFDQSNGTFKIAAAKGPVIMAPRHPDLPVPLLFKPKLAVTAISLNVNASGYAIIFGYKNVGSGSLPRRHELAVKPDYKVLIDGRQIDAGDLWIPENPPAGPGYEQPTNSGGFVPFPGPGVPFGWTIGNQITIVLDERNALGNGPSSKTSSLRLIALPVGYDLAFGPVTFDWSRGKISAMITKVGGGSPQLSKKFQVTVEGYGYHPADNVHAGPGEATATTSEGPFTILMDPAAEIPPAGPFPYRFEKGITGLYSLFYDLTFRVVPFQRDEIDESNNTVRIRFTRPSVPQGPVIESLNVLDRQDSAGKPILVPSILVNNKTPNPYTALRVVLKRNSAVMREWAIPTLKAGESRTFEASEPRPGGRYRIIYEAYLYGGGGSVLDAKTMDLNR